MDRRSVVSFLGGSLGLLLMVGCEHEAQPSSTATLFNRDEVKTAMKRLVDAASDLEGDAAGFDDENWRDVVPEVKSGIENVQAAILELRTALGYDS